MSLDEGLARDDIVNVMGLILSFLVSVLTWRRVWRRRFAWIQAKAGSVVRMSLAAHQRLILRRFETCRLVQTPRSPSSPLLVVSLDADWERLLVPPGDAPTQNVPQPSFSVARSMTPPLQTVQAARMQTVDPEEMQHSFSPPPQTVPLRILRRDLMRFAGVLGRPLLEESEEVELMANCTQTLRDMFPSWVLGEAAARELVRATVIREEDRLNSQLCANYFRFLSIMRRMHHSTGDGGAGTGPSP